MRTEATPLIQHRRNERGAGLSWIARTGMTAGAIAWLASCSGTTEPGEPTPAAPGVFVISNPVREPSGSGSGAASWAGAATGGEVVYVSLRPGTLADAIAATISNRGYSVTRPVINGGLDPVAIPADQGDTVVAAVQVSGSANPLRFGLPVPVRARPIVVRADPPPTKRDVPLNAGMLIVFSEPIDEASLTATAVQLRTSGTSVAGHLQFGDPAHLTVLLVPAEPLSAVTDYGLIVTPEVRDPSGESLEAAFTSPFTTAPAAGLRVKVTTEGDDPDPDGYVLVVGGQHARSIGVNGEEIFPSLAPGTYTVDLSGLAANCLTLGPSALQAPVGAGAITLVEFRVVCPVLPPESLLISVTTRTAGTGWHLAFQVRVDDTGDRPIAAIGYLVVNPIATGEHTVTLVPNYPATGIAGCRVSVNQVPTARVSVTVPQGGFGRVDFHVVCIP